MKPLELNIDQTEFNDIFKKQQLWQKDAADSLVSVLMNLASQARKYKKDFGGKVINRAFHSHDAILVSGGRGTGKTVFLKNAELIWKEWLTTSSEKIDGYPTIHFTSLIDPTLLHNHDSFTNVIVAHIYNETQYYLNNNVHSTDSLVFEKKRNHFYDTLRKLAEAIDHPGDKTQFSGLDKIIKYSSGIKIEFLFQSFVSAAIDIMQCDAMVLPIDDIDMALDKAYPVLEEIRRLLSCPYIIPLVSGDAGLYKSLVQISFAENTGSLPQFFGLGFLKHEKIQESEFLKIIDLTSEAYLTKVLPHQYRINLQKINDILDSLHIFYGNSSECSLTFSEYRSDIKKYFFGKMNGEERSCDFAEPESAREVVQLTRLLHPKVIKQSLLNKNNDNGTLASLRTWGDAKQHGGTYSLAKSAQQIQNISTLRLSDLFSFNLKKQSDENVSWAKYDFISEQLTMVKEYFNATAGNNNKLLSASLSGNVIRSMPPLEMHTNSVSIIRSNEKNEQTKKIIFKIYTDKTYYNSQETLQRKVFYSRAFEILGTSLIMSIQDQMDHDSSKWRKIFESIFSARPFYSVFSVNPTKTIDDYNDSDSDFAESDIQIEENLDQFISELLSWKKQYHEDINNYICNSTQLISLLSAVFNKTFSQLNILRYRYNYNDNDKLIDAVLRFFYISTNAFGFFVKEQGYIATNLAINTSSNRLRNRDTFINESSTYRDNVGWAYTENTPSAKFIQAIVNHPIFEKIIDADIKSCVEYKSAEITNSSGSKNTTSSNQKKDVVLGHKRMSGLKYFIGKNKLAPSANILLKKINNGQIDNELMDSIFDKLRNEGVDKEIDSYIKSHKNIFNALNILKRG
ncbi:hypothetical protein [Citrobacter portucalensis]|uniref:hypothetical protein n=1 Tax=Citrobacter portucalensis TaxID=1639133 RepID=UPI0030CF4D69|nr:hypothetical protein [Citrobacter freundii]